MRRLMLTAALLCCVPVSAQQLDHYLVTGLTDPDAAALELLHAGYGVVEGSVAAQTLELHATELEIAALRDQGWRADLIARGRPLQEVMAEWNAANPDAVPAGFPTVAEMLAELVATEADHPAIAKVINVTATYGAPLTENGNELFAIKLSDNVDVEEDEPSVFVMTQLHSNEVGTGLVALGAIELLTDGYATDPAIRAIVDSNEIFIAPTWNPDGVDYVHFVNQNWRKNRRDNGNGTFGVDLNRNYSAGWSAACSGSTSTSSSNYKGVAPESEPETVTCVLFTEDQRFAKMIEYHSFGQETLWGFNCTSHPWASWMLQTAQLLSTASGYGLANRPPSAEGEHYEWQFTRGAWSHLVEILTTSTPTFPVAEAEAAQVIPGLIWALQQRFTFRGHVTDACTGAPLEAELTFQGVSIPYGGSFRSTPDFGRYDLLPAPGSYTVEFSAPGYVSRSFPVTISSTPTTLDVALTSTAPTAVSYCTAGLSSIGCQALLSTSGTPSASASSGFTLMAQGLESQKDGQFFIGTNGRQANPWGNGTSYQCVVPPVTRLGLLGPTQPVGACGGTQVQDLNALWCPTCPKPNKNPGAGAVVQAQLWYRDPQSTSNQSTSLSDAVEFTLCP